MGNYDKGIVVGHAFGVADVDLRVVPGSIASFLDRLLDNSLFAVLLIFTITVVLVFALNGLLAIVEHHRSARATGERPQPSVENETPDGDTTN